MAKLGWIVVVMMVVGSVSRADVWVGPQAFRGWGEEIQSKIDAAFWMAGRNVYALEAGNGKAQRPAWIWDGSIELGALCAAARVEPERYLPRVRAYAVTHDRVSASSVLCRFKSQKITVLSALRGDG